jgi:hypothetical protein
MFIFFINTILVRFLRLILIFLNDLKLFIIIELLSFINKLFKAISFLIYF